MNTWHGLTDDRRKIAEMSTPASETARADLKDASISYGVLASSPKTPSLLLQRKTKTPGILDITKDKSGAFLLNLADEDKHPLGLKHRTGVSHRIRTKRSNRKTRTKSVRAKLLNEYGSHMNFEDSFSQLARFDTKDPESEALLRSSLKKNFVFEKLDDSAADALIQAFEPMPTCSVGHVIICQGEEGDYFYVIQSGQVTFQVNGKDVGTAKAGESFGELALLYTCPRAATVVASGSNPTRLWKLEQSVFRYALQRQTKESIAQKSDLLENIEFFSQMEAADRKQCLNVMTPRRFEAGELIVTKGEIGDAFYVIQSGTLTVTDITVGDATYENVSLGPGDFFGERALVMSEPRAANVVGVTGGTLFSIDRVTFEKVCGNFARLILKSQDKNRLSGLKVFRAARLDSEVITELTQCIEDHTYPEGKEIFRQGKMTEPILYLVREGKVLIRYANGNEKIIKEGGYFGEDFLLADAKETVSENDKVQAKYNAFVLDESTTCGTLSLMECRKIFDTRSIEICEELDQDDYIGMAADDNDEYKHMVGRRSSRRSSVSMEHLRSSLVRQSILGEGQYGEVWEVTTSLEEFIDSGKFALKIQSKSDQSRLHYSAEEAIRRECEVLSTVDHPFIVDLVHHYEDEENIYMVMGLIRGGDLWSVIHVELEDGEWRSGFSERQAKFYGLVIADTLDYLHRRKIAFRDLKPENIMVDDDGYPIIVDFGFAKTLPDGVTYTFCGTPQYLCPEVVTNGGHGFAVDHWALGVVIYEMVSGENPFSYDGIDQLTLFNDICRETPFPLPDEATPEVIDLVNRLLVKDPTQRMGSLAKGSREIKQHPWFQELDLGEIREKRWKAPFIPTLEQ